MTRIIIIRGCGYRRSAQMKYLLRIPNRTGPVCDTINLDYRGFSRGTCPLKKELKQNHETNSLYLRFPIPRTRLLTASRTSWMQKGVRFVAALATWGMVGSLSAHAHGRAGNASAWRRSWRVVEDGYRDAWRGCDALWISGTDYYNYLSNGVRLELTWASLAKMPIYITYFTPSITDKPIKMLDSWDVPASYVALINDMVSRGEIPDPKTYKGSVLRWLICYRARIELRLSRQWNYLDHCALIGLMR